MDEKGNLTATGPNSEVVRFRRFDLPGQVPCGHMFVFKID